MAGLFQSYVYGPILSVLVFIYQTLAFNDLGTAIIILTVFIRIILFPLFYKGAKDQAIMQRLQPHIKRIQEEHKENKEVQAKELLELYKKHNFNPFSGIFLLLIQIPVFIALFKLFGKELQNSAFHDHLLFGIFDLGSKGLILPFIAAMLQYAQGKLSMPKTTTTDSNPLASMGKTMVIVGPILTLIILGNLPAALSVYWITSSLFSVVQQVYINKKLPKFED